MIKRPVLTPSQLESICRSIAATQEGLSGSQIDKLLSDNNIPNIEPGVTKWRRLYSAFVNWQNKNQCSNNILNFLKSALQPINYLDNKALFESRRHEINQRLSFIGTEITEQGKLREVGVTQTITEAKQRANQFKYKLLSREVHEEVIKYCDAELLVENYFHAVFESVKSIADRLRIMTNLHADGNPLADTAFTTSNPLIRINLLANDTQRSEHIGLMNLIKGLFGLIRNPTAHTPKIKFEINEEEALDILTTVSLIHKRLDKAL